MDKLTGAVSKSFSNSLANLIDKAFQGAAGASKEGANLFATRLTIGFEKYISTTVSRCINVKTLISPNEPVLLEKAYEPVDLVVNKVKFPISDFISSLGVTRNNALITATLGSGKSFSMKYIYSRLAMDANRSRIPVFVELRNVPFSEQSLISYIHSLLSPFTNFVSEKSITSGLKAGVFALLLDGFDEISSRHRKAADTQINKLSSEFPNNVIVVSSRPDNNRFVSWHAFPEYKIDGLSLDKLERLIQKIDFDEAEKAAFKARVNKTLYKSHKPILSNPLLASMMLLTFREFQDIPSKMHVFYGTAFDVLYRRHDSTKLGYQREFKTALDLSDFKRVFMTFCLLSLIDRVYGFTATSFKRYAKKSIEYEGMTIAVEDFLYDVEKNLCVMHTEGEDINFIHRSFQEYFSALFLSKRSVDKSFEFIDSLVAESGINEFFSMLMDIDSEEFERKYLIPKLLLLEKSLTNSKTWNGKLSILSTTYLAVRVGKDEAGAIVIPVEVPSPQNLSPGNTALFLQQVGLRYGIAVYAPNNNAVDQWAKILPKWPVSDSVCVVRLSDMKFIFAKKFGLVMYIGELLKSIKVVRKDLESIHSRKKKLLSDMLNRNL